MPVESAPVAELMLCGVGWAVVVHLYEFGKEILYNFSSHHWRRERGAPFLVRQ